MRMWKCYRRRAGRKLSNIFWRSLHRLIDVNRRLEVMFRRRTLMLYGSKIARSLFPSPQAGLPTFAVSAKGEKKFAKHRFCALPNWKAMQGFPAVDL